MRTFLSLENEVLGLMFSNSAGGQKVTVDDASVKEYVINMRDCYNAGVRDISFFYPQKREYSFIAQKGVETLDLRKEDSDFMNLSGVKVYEEEESGFRNFYNFSVIGESVIIISASEGLRYTVIYNAYPKVMSETDPDSTVLSPCDAVLDAVCYYMASRLYAEDDITLSTQYMNIYEERKARLYERYQIMEAESQSYSGFDGFYSERGWF